MAQLGADVSGFVREYAALIREQRETDRDRPNRCAAHMLQEALVQQAEWTPEAADHLVDLAQRYGAFMLRNALAVALALGIEDGELGY